MDKAIRLSEFVVITQWDSLEAISQFAGTDIDKAVVPPTVQQMMIEFDDRVVHYEVKMEFCGSNRLFMFPRQH